MRLQFVKHQYGPYAVILRHALDKMDGHFIGGWVATPEQADNPAKAIAAIQAWSERKRHLMKPAHIEVAGFIWLHKNGYTQKGNNPNDIISSVVYFYLLYRQAKPNLTK